MPRARTIHVVVPRAQRAGLGARIRVSAVREARSGMDRIAARVQAGWPPGMAALKAETRTMNFPDGAALDVPDRAQFVERGRHPGRFPPVEDMRQWVQRKLAVPPSMVDSVAFRVGRKVATEGLPAHRVVEKVWVHELGARMLGEKVAASVARAASR